MLTVDLVRARRRKGELILSKLKPKARDRMVEVAELLIEVASRSVGMTRADFDEGCKELGVDGRDQKIADGLKKLVEDRCDFAMDEGIDPPTIRQTVFKLAAAQRRELEDDGVLDRWQLLTEAGQSLDLTPEQVEGGLYADLKQAHKLQLFEPISAEALMTKYELGQAQAVLFRATRIVAHVICDGPGAYRDLFRKLKFRRLLYRIQEHPEGGYAIEIDGPMSLFQSTTRYGLQLAMVLPAIRACAQWSIAADLRWGKERESLAFNLSGGAIADPEPARLADDVQVLLERFKKLKTPWRPARSRKIMNLPGVGICVPDLVFTHTGTKEKAYLEVMGYWSRDAVWKRVELVEAGLKERIIFAVSSRLRVSERVLDGELPGELYVYKGVMSAKTIATRLG